MSHIPKGTAVRQIVPVITGTTQQTRFNEEANQLEYLVAYDDDGDGVFCERWFLQSQIEVTAPATTAQVPA